MAVVGDAYIVVRALTDRVRDDIRDGFRGADREGERAGRDTGDGFARGFRRSGGSSGSMFQNLQRNAEAARERFNSLIQVGYALGPALVAVTSALGAVGGGLFAIASQAAAAGPALLSLINIFSAVAQAAAVLKAVFSGVGAAISAGLNQGGGGGGGGGVDLARQIEDANRRIEDAQRRLAQVIQQNNERIVQANREIERAERNKRDALYESEQANLAVTEAEEDLQKAYAATAEARKQAAEDIQQLNFALEDAVLSEERAVLAFEKAQEEYAKAQNLPPNNRQRREAELAFKEADLRLRQARDKTNDTQAEVDEANAKGVEGSDRVVSALEREKDAAKGVDDAKRSAYLASRDYADAVEAEKDAINNLNAVIAENASRLAEAERAVEDAQRALEDIKNSAGGAGGGVNAFADAMAKLSPAAQEFVRIILGIVEAFKPIKLLAQEAFFTNFNDAVQELADVYLPVLEEKLPKTAGLLGEIGANILGVVSSTENVARVERIWDSNDIVIRNLGGAVTNLVDILLILLDNLRPLAEEFSGWIESVTTGWRETLTLKDKTGELSGTLEYSAGVVRQLGRVFGNLFRTIGNIGKAAAGPGSGGEMLLNLFEGVTKKWEEFTGSLEGQNKLEKFFIDIVPVVSEFGGLISDIFGAIFRITGESTEETASFIGSLRTVVGTFEEIGTSISGALPIAGEFLEKAAEAINNLTSSGAIETFFGVLRDAAGVIASVTGSPIFQQIFAVVAPIFAISRGLGLVYKFLNFIFLGAIVGNITKLGGLFKGLGTAIRLVSKPAASLRLLMIKFPLVFKALAFAISPVGLVIAGLVAAFIAMWNESEIFRNAIKDLIDNVLTKLKEAFDKIKEAVEKALEPFGGGEGIINALKNAFKFLGDIIGTYVVPIISNLLGWLIELIAFLAVKIIEAIGFLWKFWKMVWDALYAIVETVVVWFRDTAWPIIQVVIDLIIAYYTVLWNAVKFVWDLIYGAIEFVVNWFRDTVWPIIQTVIDLIVAYYTVLWNGVKLAWDLIYGAIEFVVNWFQNTVWPIIQTVAGYIEGAFNSLKIILEVAWNLIYIAIETVVNWFRDTVWPIFQTVAGYIGGAIDSLKIIIEVAWNLIKIAIDAVVNWFRDNAWPVIETVIGFIETGYNNLKKGVETAWNLIKTAINTVATWLKNTLEPLVNGVWTAIKTAAETLKTNIETIWNNIKKAIDTAVGLIKTAVKPIWDGIDTALETIKKTLVGANGEGGIWGKIKTAVDTVVGGIKGVISGIWDGLTSGLSTVVSTIKSTLNGVIRVVNGVIEGFNRLPGPDLTPIPELAEGGVIRPRAGGTLALIAEAGRAERVEPLDDNGLSRRDKAMIDYLSGGKGGGGMTINVYPSAGMDERDLAQKVSRELALQIRRGAI